MKDSLTVRSAFKSSELLKFLAGRADKDANPAHRLSPSKYYPSPGDLAAFLIVNAIPNQPAGHAPNNVRFLYEIIEDDLCLNREEFRLRSSTRNVHLLRIGKGQPHSKP